MCYSKDEGTPCRRFKTIINAGKTAERKTMIDNAEKALWRDVKENDVLEAVSGSFLQTICTAFGKNYTPKAPLSLILMQGITLMSCALTQRADTGA